MPGEEYGHVEQEKRHDPGGKARRCGKNDGTAGIDFVQQRHGRLPAEHRGIKQRHEQQVEGEEPRGLEGREEHQRVKCAGQGSDDRRASRSLPGGQREIAQHRQQHRAIDLDVDELDCVEIAEREQERADGGEGRRHAEMADGKPAKAEKADRRHRGHHRHEGGERIEAEAAQRRIGRADEEERVGVAERAARGEEDDGVGPMHRASEYVAPVLDDREGEIAVLLVAEGTVEAGEQPAAKHQGKAKGEQREREQAVAPRQARCWRRVLHRDFDFEPFSPVIARLDRAIQ